MASRRDVLVGGGTSLAALGFGLMPDAIAAAAPRSRAAQVPHFLIDSTIAAEVGDLAERSGSATVRYSGDIGAPWFDRLEPLQRQYPYSLAGVTYGGAFFCLEHLARACGLVCTFRSCPPFPGADRLAGTDAHRVVGALLGAASPGAAALRVAGRAPGEAGDRPLAWLLQPVVKR